MALVRPMGNVEKTAENRLLTNLQPNCPTPKLIFRYKKNFVKRPYLRSGRPVENRPPMLCTIYAYGRPLQPLPRRLDCLVIIVFD